MPDEFSCSWQDARADAEWKLEDLMRRSPTRSGAEERPMRRRYAFQRPAETGEPPKPKAEPERDPSRVWEAWEAWLDGRIAASLQEDGRIGAVIAECLAQVLDDVHAKINNERTARVKFEDRCRELEIKVSQLDVALAKKDIEIVRQDLAIAELERRLANGDRRIGAIDGSASMKTIN
jgi:hypothetical protein